jgi:hypothetical protein
MPNGPLPIGLSTAQDVDVFPPATFKDRVINLLCRILDTSTVKMALASSTSQRQAVSRNTKGTKFLEFVPVVPTS